jgi:hypothetical protein
MESMREFADKSSCKYNQGVICGWQTNCEACGWNPSVSEMRTQKIRDEENRKGKKK